jgi:hypothetical protein
MYMRMRNRLASYLTDIDTDVEPEDPFVAGDMLVAQLLEQFPQPRLLAQGDR